VDLGEEMTFCRRFFSLSIAGKGAVFLRLILVTGVLLPLLFALSCGPAPETGETGGKAPDFTLLDLDGEPFHLKVERGKMVLIIFTTTWCPSCRASIPLYRDIHAAYGPQGLVVVNVDIQEPPDKLRQFVKANQIPYRVLLDQDGEVGMAYGIVGIPALVLIDQDGERISSDTATIVEILEKVYKRTAAFSP